MVPALRIWCRLCLGTDQSSLIMPFAAQLRISDVTRKCPVLGLCTFVAGICWDPPLSIQPLPLLPPLPVPGL